MSHTLSKRRHIRFKPDPMDYAQVDTRAPSEGEFKAEMVALIVEEAPMGGVGLVMLDSGKLAKGGQCRVQVGRMAPLPAEVVWVKNIDEGIVRVGLKYLA